MKRLLVNLALLSGTMLLLLIAGEIFCRLFYPDRNLRYIEDADTITRFEPSQDGLLTISDGVTTFPISINELGLRERPLSALSRRRILFIGDSFTFGWGVENRDRFSDKIQAALPAGPDGGISTVNAGHPGFGMYQV